MSGAPDLLIVGSGISGAACALEASSLGLSFRGIDMAPGFGGTARLGGGGICIPGSAMQRAAGIEDDPATAFRDLVAGGNEVDEAWARLYFANAEREVYEWLLAAGVAFDRIHFIEGDSVPRWHAPRGLGAAVMATLWRRLAERGRDRAWRFGVRCEGLIARDGAVRGVRGRDADGREVEIEASHVVLATGGFAGSLGAVRRSGGAIAAAERVLAAGGPNALGLGHGIVAEAGGVLTNLSHVYGYATGIPDYRDPTGERAVIARDCRDWIWLNRDGRRFHDELNATSGTSALPALLAQPGQTCWAVLDTPAIESLNVVDHYGEPNAETFNAAARRHLANSGHVAVAGSIGALMDRIGIGPRGGATVAEWNARGAQRDRDPLTGRDLSGFRAIEAGPFYAVQLFPAARKNLGGVRTDLLCRVLGHDGAAIPNLYAVGELAGFAGGRIAGSRPLEGMMVGASAFSGRRAARAIAGIS